MSSAATALNASTRGWKKTCGIRRTLTEEPGAGHSEDQD